MAQIFEIFEEANRLFEERNLKDCLRVLEDSELNLNDYPQLLKLKGLSLILETVDELMGKEMFSEAVEAFKACKIVPEVHPKLLEAYEACLKAMKEKELPETCFNTAKHMYKNKKYNEALKLIDGSGLDLKVHTKVMRVRINCLIALKNQSEAFEGAKFFLDNGLQMTSKLVEVLVDEFILRGQPEKALQIYEKLCNDITTSRNDKELYSMKAKEISQSLETDKDARNTTQLESLKDKTVEEAQVPSVQEESSRNTMQLESLKDKTVEEGQVPAVQEESSRNTTQLESLKDKTMEEGRGPAVQEESSRSSYLTGIISYLLLKRCADIRHESASFKGKEVEVKARPAREESFKRLGEIKFNYEVGNHLGSRLYMGKTVCQSTSSDKSFFDVTYTQKKNFKDLKSLGIGNEFAVNVDSMITGILGPFEMVVGPLIPILEYFRGELKIFKGPNDCQERRKLWWQQIAIDFTEIFRDVAHGLTYLDSRGESCQKLAESVFICEKGTGKIMPSMGKHRTDVITQLIALMESIITLPFTEETVDESYELPLELTRFLALKTNEMLIQFPLSWLCFYPFFWSTDECVDFIVDLKHYIRDNSIKSDRINTQLVVADPSYEGGNWSVGISGGYKTILDRPKLKGPNVKESVEKPVDLVRFMGNVYGHLSTVKAANSTTTTTARVEAEAYFRSLFPKIYVNLFEALCRYVHTYTDTSAIVEAFKKWTKPYIAIQPRQSIVKKWQNIRETLSKEL